MTNRKVRLRFAPSPTGPLHIGGVRTALFNYLFAKKHNGDFILRIEDTDQARYVPGAEEYIMKSLEWCNIIPDEGIKQGGDFGPYRQSDRKELYKKYANILIEKEKAYYAFDTPEELDEMREQLKDKGVKVPQYNSKSRKTMKNSLVLSPDEVQQRIKNGEPYVIRFKMPENEEIHIKDIVRGEMTVNSSTLDDKVLFKSDGMPTYHLANVVDDYSMKISHVIRGEEWLPSLPLHVMMYRAFGREAEMPEFAHLSLLLKPSGKGKLSKRDGDKLGFPVFPLEWTDPKTNDKSMGYRENGYFADAFINLLALLGWNSGTEQEIFSLDELCEIFSLERVVKSGARFDPEKAKWFNHQYLQSYPIDKLSKEFQTILQEKGLSFSDEYVGKVISLVRERVNFVNELWDQSYYFFKTPESYNPKVVKKRWKANTPDLMKSLIDILKECSYFDAETTESKVKTWIETEELSMGAVMNAFRLCIVGDGMGPHIFNIIEMIGKDETIKRLEKGIAEIKK